MSEPTITETVSKKNGQKYYNLTLRTTVKDGKVLQGIDPEGEGIIVEKLTVEGYKNVKFDRPSYSCRVNYKDREVSFFLKEQEHKEFEACGGIGDKVRLTTKVEKYTYDNKESSKIVVHCELV